MRRDRSFDKLARLYLKEWSQRHGINVSIICDRDPSFAETPISGGHFRTLWYKLGYESTALPSTNLHGQRRGQYKTLRIYQARMQAARDRQKVRRRSSSKLNQWNFQVGDKLCLNCRPWKGVYVFRQTGKLNPRRTLPFPLDGLNLDDKLHFVEEPVEIVGREVKRLKRSWIPLVKVRWNSRRGPEFTWEREEQFMKKYPHLHTKTTLRKCCIVSLEDKARLMGEVYNTPWLVPNLEFLQQSYVPPTNKELEILFQPMFDEYLEPPRIERPVSPALAVLVLVNSVDTISMLQQGIAAESTIMEDNPLAPVDNDPFINVFAQEPSSEASSSEDVSTAESTYVTQTPHHLRKWSKGITP
ncbi:hypothetical protein Tco_0893459 [Tanacetum coccineum]|uniref:Reverse transcriptase domain-containing protein n=1 Tax=Tanacetum coccineum TaxID=301880 RepID=A0ABQ5CBL5_9ASTR